MANHERCYPLTQIVGLSKCNDCKKVLIETERFTFDQWELGPDKYNEIRSKLELIADELNKLGEERFTGSSHIKRVENED